MIPRFFCPPEHCTLGPGAVVELPESIAHHALRVLRMQVGDALTLFDGSGGEWRAEIVGAGRTARVAVHDFLARECESPLDLTLAQALPGGDRMDWVVEKCVELGVAAIQPVATKRSVIRLAPERMARRIAHWNQIARAACAQCGRNRIPQVAAVLDLPQYLATTSRQNALRLLLTPQADLTLHALARPSCPVILMVGPEGGWENAEMQAAQAAGFLAVRLGPRVLRSETAGMAALAALQALWGDF